MEKRIKRLYILIFALIVVLAVFDLYLYRPAIYAELDTLKLIPRPERLTELYLNDSLKLPKTINKGDVVPFSFAVHNLEGKTTTYPYVIYIQSSDGSTIPIDRSSVTLADQTSTTIRESYTFKTASTSAEVFIELTGRNQSLHFVLPNRE